MKTIFRIPTTDYAYIEVQEDKEMTPQAVIERFRELQRAYSGGFGIEVKEWQKALDGYLQGKPLMPDTYAEMNADQQRQIQEIKKAFARMKSKSPKETDGAFYQADEGNGPGKGEGGDWSGQD